MKKLSLKRKPAVQSIVKETKITKFDDSEPNDRTDEPEICILSSDTDDEVPGTGAPEQAILQSMGHSDTERGFLDVNDPQLLRLRKMILRMSNCDSNTSLTPFPAHTQPPGKDATSVKTFRHSTCLSCHDVQGREMMSSKLCENKELSPFPSMCDWCRRRSSQTHQWLADTAKRLCKNMGADLLNHKLAKEITPNEREVCSHKSYLNEVDKTEDNFAEVHGSKGVYQCLKERHGVKNDYTSFSPSAGISVAESHNSASVLSLGGLRSSASADFNNSHLMRDRNSNLYSLQSSNCPGRSQSRKEREDISRPHNMDVRQSDPNSAQIQLSSLESDRAAQSKNKLNTKPLVNTDTTSCLESKQNHKHNNMSRSAQDENCSNSYLINCKKIDGKTTLDSNKTSLSLRSNDQQGHSVASIKTSAVVTDSRTMPEMSGVPHISVTQPDNSFSSLCPATQPDNSFSSLCPATQNAVSSFRSCDSTSNSLAPSVATSKCLSGPSSRTDLPLPCCPLCQLQFKKGMQQVEIDGHIAQCLSSAEDDVMW